MREYPFEMWTLPALLHDKIQRIPDQLYMMCDDQRLTYRQLSEQVNRAANAYLDMGVKKGDKVCLLMQNSPEYVVAWFGLAMIGAILVPININLKGQVLSYIINNSDARTMVIDDSFLPSFVFVQDELEQIQRVIVLSESGEGPAAELSARFTVQDFDVLLAGSDQDPGVEVRPQDTMAIMYTSGTTGPSKGVILSQAHYFLTAAQVNSYMDYRTDDVVYTCLPLFHANAATLAVYGVLLCECTLALGRKFSLTHFWDEMRRYGVTKTNLMGSMLLLLLRQDPTPRDQDNQLKIVNSVPLIPENKEFDERFGLKLIGMFGTTETSIVTVIPYDEEVRPGSCGKTLDLFTVQIVDDNDMPCPPQIPGEIVVRGNLAYSQMDGYYKLPEATLEVFRNLWYHTGDYGYTDEDGYLYFVDRKKDSIRRRGENISSFEVESVINSFSAVLESAAVAVPSDLSEDDVMVVVIPKAGQEVVPEELLDYCTDRLAYFALPRYVKVVDDLPKTPNQKVEKYRLREEGAAGAWDRETAGYKVRR